MFHGVTQAFKHASVFIIIAVDCMKFTVQSLLAPLLYTIYMDCSKLAGLQILSRLINRHHGKCNPTCPLYDCTLLEVSVIKHVLTEHWAELRLEQKTDVDWLLNRFVNLNVGFVAK